MANSKNWPFKPLLGSQQAINNHPIKKGQFLIRKDGALSTLIRMMKHEFS